MWEKCLLAEWIFADSNPGVENMCGLSLVVGSLTCFKSFFLWVLQFSPLHKN